MYNITGQKIRTLADRFYAAGSHELTEGSKSLLLLLLLVRSLRMLEELAGDAS